MTADGLKLTYLNCCRVGCSVLCLDSRNYVFFFSIYDVYFFNRTVSCCVYVHEIILEHWISEDLNPTKAVKCRYLLVLTINLTFLVLFFFALILFSTSWPEGIFCGRCLWSSQEPSTDCFWMGNMFFNVHITLYFSPNISVLHFFFFLWILAWIFKDVLNVLLDWKINLLYWH